MYINTFWDLNIYTQQQFVVAMSVWKKCLFEQQVFGVTKKNQSSGFFDQILLNPLHRTSCKEKFYLFLRFLFSQIDFVLILIWQQWIGELTIKLSEEKLWFLSFPFLFVFVSFHLLSFSVIFTLKVLFVFCLQGCVSFSLIFHLFIAVMTKVEEFIENEKIHLT